MFTATILLVSLRSRSACPAVSNLTVVVMSSSRPGLLTLGSSKGKPSTFTFTNGSTTLRGGNLNYCLSVEADVWGDDCDKQWFTCPGHFSERIGQ